MIIDLRTANLTELPDQMMRNKQDTGTHRVIFDGAYDAYLPARSLIVNLIFWEPNWSFGIIPSADDYITIKSMTPGQVQSIQKQFYEKALDQLPNVPHMRIVLAYLYNIDRLSNFVQRWLGDYMPSIDVLGLSTIMHHPSIQKILNRKIPENCGTKVAEGILENSSHQLQAKLQTIEGKENCLYPYMRAQALKSTQIPQVLYAYGTRSDIDDTMMDYVIKSSSLGGLQNVRDYAVEYLSAKKSVYFSHDVIKETQYFARQMRLASSSIRIIHPGSCGSEGWIPFTIERSHKKNFYSRMVIDDDGSRVVLDSKNIEKYLDHPIRLVSQFACRYTDGFCEHCAGFGRDRLLRYMPVDIHIGCLAVFKLASLLSQRVLSTKHLINGKTLVYALTDVARKYLSKDGNQLFWNNRIDLNELMIRIPKTAIHQLSDLECRRMPSVTAFSKIAYCDLCTLDGNVIDRIDLNTEVFTPYFTEEMLSFIKEHLSRVQLTPDSVQIPLTGFDTTLPAFQFTLMNDDMRAFVKKIMTYLKNQIASHTNVTTALSDFESLIYSKADINSFFLETVVRSHLITSLDDYSIPVVTDPTQVLFGNIGDVISERTITGKLGFQGLKDYIRKANTVLLTKPAGMFSPYFGII